MTTTLHAISRPCPICGYDLRATLSLPDPRCPECGTKVHRALPASRLPWVHRAYRGKIRAFLQTAALVLFKPWVLAKERHVRRKDAASFHRLCLIVATIFATGLLMVAFAIRTGQWMESLTA